MTRLWILGAADPEMNEIEKLLRKAGEDVAHALHAGAPDDRRVRPDEAYGEYATVRPRPGPDQEVILVECGGPDLPAGVVVDHHRPGDPGYGRPPAEFLAASSLGQVMVILSRHGWRPKWPRRESSGDELIQELGNDLNDGVDWGLRDWHIGPSRAYVIPDELVLAAAADHCLAAAYAGQCPGVDPGALGRWRAESRAVFQRRSVEAILADVAAATTAILAAPELWLNGELVADLRGRPGGSPPEAPEAAARAGRAILTRTVGPDGRAKIGIMGSEGPAVAAFLESWALDQGLTGLYGDPARGFAGGYERPQTV